MAWEWTTPKGTDDVAGVVSLEPLVVELRGSDRTQLMRVDPASGDTVTIEGYDGNALREGFMSACGGFSLTCDLARVADGKLILMTI